MKTLIAFALLLMSAYPAVAQEPTTETTPSETEPAIPQYAYCEIIADHIPSYTGDGVLFDFGQQTGTWAYNWLRNSKGERIIFNSSIEALNYMVCRNWEFVQAYTSGEKNQNTHMLLRIQTSALTQTQLQQLLAEPRSKAEKKK